MTVLSIVRTCHIQNDKCPFIFPLKVNLVAVVFITTKFTCRMSQLPMRHISSCSNGLWLKTGCFILKDEGVQKEQITMETRQNRGTNEQIDRANTERSLCPKIWIRKFFDLRSMRLIIINGNYSIHLTFRRFFRLFSLLSSSSPLLWQHTQWEQTANKSHEKKKYENRPLAFAIFTNWLISVIRVVV